MFLRGSDQNQTVLVVLVRFRVNRVVQSWRRSSGLDSQMFKSFSLRRSGDSGLVIRMTMKLENYLRARRSFFFF